MARKGRLDRGLMQKRDASGKSFVRLALSQREGTAIWQFSTKTAARDFYEKGEAGAKDRRFFQSDTNGGYELIEDTIDRYLFDHYDQETHDPICRAIFCQMVERLFRGQATQYDHGQSVGRGATDAVGHRGAGGEGEGGYE